MKQTIYGLVLFGIKRNYKVLIMVVAESVAVISGAATSASKMAVLCVSIGTREKGQKNK